MALFIKFDGVDGECADKDHKAWSDVLSFSWGLSKAGAGAT
jgi:type VI secretion system secreted protein Hcp